MTDVLNVLILSGHMTREHDNEFRSFRLHNQWLTTLLEDTGRFRVRVVEDPRGLGAEVIDKYDAVIVEFEGRDGYFDKAIGFGPETDAALLKFVHDDGKGIVWLHGSAAQEDDWGYPEECNVMRGSRLTVAGGLRPRPWGEAQLDTVDPRHPITDGIGARWSVTGDDILTGVTIGHDIDTFRRIEFISMFPRGVEWAATGEVSLEGPDRRGERRFLPWPYYNREG
ncbi:ThuA domain-containing protein [Microbacterium sp. LWH3-1.2]|uniref:ThuA domain-containing protein n=1 Tax=Microbacterium sp. LWH3-1.2 TaxID=3135256 RepID=UPI00342BDB6D